MIVLHTAIAIALVIGLIIRGRVDPVISLMLGSLYLGLASGAGFAGTLEAITLGFGEIMAEVGLLIGFGVVIGSLLHATGAFKRMISALVAAVCVRGAPPVDRWPRDVESHSTLRLAEHRPDPGDGGHLPHRSSRSWRVRS